MAYKEVVDLSTDTVISLGGINRKTGVKNQTSVEGYYLGSKPVADKKKKSGTSYIHIFQTAKGNLGVWGKTDMDHKLLSIPAGQMTKVSFEKMVPTPNGEMYKYKVQSDDANTIEVLGQADLTETEDIAETTTDDSFDAEETDTLAEEEEAELALAAAQLERQAKVKALLAKAKNKNQ